MSPTDSVSQWLEQLRAGDQAVADPLWRRFFQRMVGLARDRLQGRARAAADEEDVALSAFDSFCRGAEQGRFPQLNDRHDLWRLLFTLTERKAIALLRREHRQKRGGGRVVGEGALAGPDSPGGTLDQMVGREPSPELAAILAEEVACRLEALAEDDLRAIALAKMEGRTVEQIAARLGCAPRTVERKLRMIRSLWEQEGGVVVEEEDATGRES
jgi:DNA-directed RNA polymerase specialized sigma24 family protein